MSFIKHQSPLFVIGSPRSGTSLLRLILTSHSKIIIPPECGFIVWLYDKYKSWNRSSNNKYKLALFIDDLFRCKKIDTWNLCKHDVSKKIYSLQPENYAELCAAIYSAYADKAGKGYEYWGDKNNYYLNHLNELINVYPNAKFLHIVRDGRDIACSYREVMTNKSTSPYAPELETQIQDIAHIWKNDITKIDDFLSLLPCGYAMTIRYEDLVAKPSYIVKGICNWIDIPFEVGMMDFYKQNADKKLEPDLTLDWKKRTLQPISTDTVGRYIDLLNTEEQGDFLYIANSVLRKFNYS